MPYEYRYMKNPIKMKAVPGMGGKGDKWRG
jgi:hypothetical protein